MSYTRMLRRLALLTIPLATLLSPGIAGSNEVDYVPGELLIKFHPSVQSSDREAALSRLGATRLRQANWLGWDRVRLVGLTVSQARDRCAREAAIEFAEPNHYVYALATPDDSLFWAEWHLNNTGQFGADSTSDIRAVAGWNFISESPNVVIGWLDTGIDSLHEDLVDNIWTNPDETWDGTDEDGNDLIDDVHGYDFVNGDPQPYDDGTYAGHGTATSSMGAARGNNGKGVTGVTWKAQIAPLKMIWDVDAAVDAIGYCIDKEMPISNNSWGTSSYNEELYQATSAACTSGHLLIAAAGNVGTNNDVLPVYPASFDLDCIISVAMSNTREDSLVGHSPSPPCDGPAPYEASNYGATSVDLAAPGRLIWKAVAGGSYYHQSCGTSNAAPLVTGAAALLLAQDSTRTATEIKARILSTVDTVDVLTGKTVTGGRLNLDRALDNIAPEDIDDLDPWVVSRTAIYSDWTAPGDDSTSGKAMAYDLRYSESIITEGNFSSADQAGTDPPSTAGTTDGESASGLDECTWHYFAIKSEDNAFNESGISNVDSLKTLCGATTKRCVKS